MLTISFANSKGGVGKTTACVCLAGAYARAGALVHIIDLDSNGTLSRWLSNDATRPPNITVSKAVPQSLTEHLQKVARQYTPDLCLIDLAGAYEVALSIALFRSQLTLLPVCAASEPECIEAIRVAAFIKDLFKEKAAGRTPHYRVLLTRTTYPVSHSHFHGVDQLRANKMPMLASSLRDRIAYKEIGFSGLPPHFAPVRDTTAKAILELDLLMGEVNHLLQHIESTSPPATNAEHAA